MTNEEMDRAIAEAVGWSDLHKGPHDRTYMGRFKDHRLHPIPAYSTDLNAMHEAEEFLVNADDGSNSGCLRYRFAYFLYNVTVPKNIQPIRAKATHRAEAFLRTIGKHHATNPLP